MDLPPGPRNPVANQGLPFGIPRLNRRHPFFRDEVSEVSWGWGGEPKKNGILEFFFLFLLQELNTCYIKKIPSKFINKQLEIYIPQNPFFGETHHLFSQSWVSASWLLRVTNQVLWVGSKSGSSGFWLADVDTVDERNPTKPIDTLQGKTYPPDFWYVWVDDFPFPEVGYVSFFGGYCRWLKSVNSPVEVVSLSYYLQGVWHPKSCRISAINSLETILFLKIRFHGQQVVSWIFFH